MIELVLAWASGVCTGASVGLGLVGWLAIREARRPRKPADQ